MAEERDPKTHYSYEEMVARLRDNRPEGSKVKSEEKEVDPNTGKVTVRKQKKRRTSSNKTGLLKDAARRKFLQRLVMFGLPSLGLLAAAAYLVAMGAVSTTRFQEGLGASLGKELGLAGPVAVQEASLVGLTLKVKAATISGREGNFFHSAEGSGIEMRLDPKSFLGGDWTVDVCLVSKATVRLATPSPTQASTWFPGRPVLVPAGFLLSENPSRIHFSDVTLEQIDLLFGTGDPEKSPGLHRVRASLVRRGMQPGGTFYDAQITGGRDGRLVLPGWPPFRVESMRADLKNTQATIKRSVLHFPLDEAAKTKERASIVEAHGTIPYEAGKSASIDMTARGLLLSDLMPKNAQRNFTGIFRSDGLRLTYNTSSPSTTWRLQGPVTIQVARLKGLRLFNLLQSITGGEVTAFDFDECQFVIDMTPSGTSLTEIRASAVGRAHLTGQLTIAPRGELDGTVRFGLANETLLEKFPDFFKAGEEASSWTTVKIGGTASSPGEDLSARLQVWLATQPGGVPNPRINQPELPDEDADPDAPVERPNKGADDERLEGLFDDLLDDKPRENNPGR